jgi:hypothetical protein
VDGERIGEDGFDLLNLSPRVVPLAKGAESVEVSLLAVLALLLKLALKLR